MGGVVARAKQMATMWHGGQTRRYTNEPYIVHPAAVADLVASVPHTEAMLCAAWLHDVVEDTWASLKDVDNAFGREVSTLVWMLTDVSKPYDGNRERRKALDRAHIAAASPEAKTIKLADLIDNSASIVANDPDFAKVYMAEKALLLEVLREGDQRLWEVASRAVTEYYRGEKV